MKASVVKKKLISAVPAPVLKLIKQLPKKGEVFLVGGSVRDAFLRRETKDSDIVVRNVAIRTLQRQLQKMGSVELVGKHFGVFKWMPKTWKGEAIDVALPRVDHAFGTGGYKDVTTQSDPRLPITQDLQRRDYTVNALAFDVKQRELIDVVGGLSDLAAKQLRTVGEPQVRFHEDYSRMLRGLRFSSQLGFQFDGHTAKIVRIMIHHLQEQNDQGEWIVPRETIATEVIKMFVADPVHAFDACVVHNVFDVLMPEVMALRGCPQPQQYHVEGDVLQHTRLAIENLEHPYFKKRFPKHTPTALLLFGILLHDIGKPKTITFPAPGSTDRIRYNNHDAVGADIARNIATRLHLSVFPRSNTLLHVDPDDLAWLVRYHLVGFRNDIKNMKPSTVEKYYFHPHHPSDALLQLQCLDTIATVGKNKKIDDSGYRAIYQTVHGMGMRRKRTGVRPLLSGHEIMTTLGIPSGPKVGRILQEVRDAQLKGVLAHKKDALRFIKRNR